MGKISFSDGLAVGGAILAILLVVLDKAGKLRGPVLLVLLAVAACMAIPLLFSLSWVADASPGLVILARRALMIFLLGSVWAGLCVWITSEDSKEVRNVPQQVIPLAPSPDLSKTARPYADIEELTFASLPESATVGVPKASVQENANKRSYIIIKAPNGDALFYSFRNIGDIPARDIRHIQRATVIDNDKETEIAIPPSPTTGDLLYKGQSGIYCALLPVGSAYSGKENAGGILRTVLLMTYRGDESDPNVYFFRVILRFKRTPRPQKGSEVRIESRQDGVVKNLQDLLR